MMDKTYDSLNVDVGVFLEQSPNDFQMITLDRMNQYSVPVLQDKQTTTEM